jgi:hypothetical protein
MAEVEERLKSLSSRTQAKLGVQASKAAQDALKQRLASVATELALEWIVGERRFESQGEQAEYWLARLYEEIFVDEQPEARSIYDRFGFSLPRAQYLARLLRARRSAHWRSAARIEVVSALEGIEAKAKAAAAKDAARTQRFDLSLSRGGYEELIVRHDFVAAKVTGQARPVPPKRIPSSPNLLWFSITAETALAILTLIREEKP